MINPKKGIIALCDSNFVINKHTVPQDIEGHISSLISHKRDVNTGYTHYSCWLDIEPQVYVSASICFYGNRIDSIRIYPQHQSTVIPAPPQHPMEIEESNKLAYAWYCKHFERDELWFRWGGIRYCQGNDPIYHPTTVLIEFKHT